MVDAAGIIEENLLAPGWRFAVWKETDGSFRARLSAPDGRDPNPPTADGKTVEAAIAGVVGQLSPPEADDPLDDLL